MFLARLLEHFVRFCLVEHNPIGNFLPHMIATFSWDRFAAIQIWIFVLFLIYVTGSELNHLFGDGELRRILFTNRRSELQLNRRQRIRELRRLSRVIIILSRFIESEPDIRPGAPFDDDHAAGEWSVQWPSRPNTLTTPSSTCCTE